MKKPFMQVASDGVYELIVEGIISSEMWWGDEFTPDMVREELAQANGNPIRIIINSPGGEVFAGAAIYNALLQYQGRKTVRVDGVAASMASVIAMVGDEIYMSPGSTMMVHRPLVGAYGNVKDLEKAIEMLEAIEDTIIPIYAKRTGLSNDKIFELLDEEKWLSPDEAVGLGFADKLEEESQSATAFEKIKAMLTNEQFAFSMSAVHKSLEDYVTKAEAPTEETEVQTEETKDVDTTVVETQQTVDESTDVTEDVTETEEVTTEVDETEESAEDAPEAEEVTEPTATETIKPVAKVNMSKEIATETVVPAPTDLADPAVATAKDKKITKTEARKMIVEALAAKYAKNEKAFAEIDKKLKATMVIDGDSGDVIYGQEVLARDIRERYERSAKVGSLVNRIDIEGAETYSQLIETAGNGFQEVALGGVKSQDQPLWTKQSQTPHEWALIVAWLDGVQKRSPIAVYNRIVRYIAKQYSKLESKIILSYEGGTFDGETRPATGLVPLLEDANRVVHVDSYDSEDLMPKMGVAYGQIESDDELVLVANRRTWGKLAVSLDNNGNTVFVRVGEKIAAGALGEFTLVQDSALEDGQVVFGVMEDYDLVLRGNLEYLFSREATIGTGENALNLFTQDASALRADVDLTGAPVFLQSFILLEIEGTS